MRGVRAVKGGLGPGGPGVGSAGGKPGRRGSGLALRVWRGGRAGPRDQLRRGLRSPQLRARGPASHAARARPCGPFPARAPPGGPVCSPAVLCPPCAPPPRPGVLAALGPPGVRGAGGLGGRRLGRRAQPGRSHGDGRRGSEEPAQRAFVPGTCGHGPCAHPPSTAHGGAPAGWGCGSGGRPRGAERSHPPALPRAQVGADKGQQVGARLRGEGAGSPWPPATLRRRARSPWPPCPVCRSFCETASAALGGLQTGSHPGSGSPPPAPTRSRAISPHRAQRSVAAAAHKGGRPRAGGWVAVQREAPQIN